MLKFLEVCGNIEDIRIFNATLQLIKKNNIVNQFFDKLMIMDEKCFKAHCEIFRPN